MILSASKEMMKFSIVLLSKSAIEAVPINSVCVMLIFSSSFKTKAPKTIKRMSSKKAMPLLR